MARTASFSVAFKKVSDLRNKVAKLSKAQSELDIAEAALSEFSEEDRVKESTNRIATLRAELALLEGTDSPENTESNPES